MSPYSRLPLIQLSDALRLLHNSERIIDLSVHVMRGMRSLLGPDHCRMDWRGEARVLRLAAAEQRNTCIEEKGRVLRFLPAAPHDPSVTLTVLDEPALFRNSIEIDLELDFGGRLTLLQSREVGSYSNEDMQLLGLYAQHVKDVVTRRMHSRPRRRRSDRLNEQRLTDVLSERERQVLDCLGARLGNREIAERLQISDGTVKRHLENIYQKLAVSGRHEARIVYASGQQTAAGDTSPKT